MGRSLARRPVARSRPAATAAPSAAGSSVAQIGIKVQGAALSERVKTQLVRANVEGSVHLPDMTELEFLDADFEVSDAKPFKIGDPLKIELGDSSAMVEVFSGEVTGIELAVTTDGSPTMLIRAYDKSHRLRRGTQTRTWLNQSDSDVASEIAGEAGLSGDVQSTTTQDYILQHNQTNWEFLQERARRHGFELQVADDKLVFKPPTSVPAGDVELALVDQLSSFRARMSSAQQVDEVEVRGWDPKDKKEIVGTATRPAVTTSIKESRTGDAVAKSAFGAAKVMVAREPVHTREQADELAQAVLDELAQDFVIAEGVAIGDPGLRVGATVELKNLGAQFSGEYVVTEARHIYTATGYRNEFRATGRRSTDVLSLVTRPEPAPLNLLPAIVTNLQDPDELARVKVKFPTLGDSVESDWCRVVSAGAGAERGIEFIPEVDDEVLVIAGDMTRPFVLGGLWNGKDKPPEVPGAENNLRLIRSRSGHTIILDDTDGAEGITIVDKTENNRVYIDSANNKIEVIADGDIEITAKGDLKLKANGNIEIEAGQELSLSSGAATTIEATADMTVKGMGATVEASAQLALKGATASLEGSASTEVKGGIVRIN